MKKLVSLLLLTGAAAMATTAFARGVDFPNGREPLYKSSGGSVTRIGNTLRTSAPGTDSTYIGYTPLNKTAANPWSIRAATGGPGVHKPPAAGSTWNFDPAGEATANGFINGDSLQGWWPDRLNGRFASQWALGFVNNDFDEPNGSLDWGNKIAYYPVQGRTYGIISAWHRDHGNGPAGLAEGVGWAPLAGSYSAWCGLRRARDNQYIDAQTNQPINADAAIFNVNNRFSNPQQLSNFPGYCDGWDQILYRDIDVSSNLAGDLTVGFTYSTRLSGTIDFEGWFDRDPLSVTSDGAGGNCAPGNYISNTDLASPGVIDSFQVYIGAPTESTYQPFDDCSPGTPARASIYDPLRRWFDQVIEANNATLYRQLVSAWGNDSARVVSQSIPNSVIAPIAAASGGKVRLVFRVKTNNRGSDETISAQKTNGRGAAVVDNVTYSISGGSSSPAGWGQFELASDVNNAQTALNAWRTTSRPPQMYGHREVLGTSQAPYFDLCGSVPTVAGRLCSAVNGILTPGDHDNLHRLGRDVVGTADRSPAIAFISPTIQLRSNNGSWPNNIGITAPGNPGDAIAGKDYLVDYEIHAAAANNPNTGVLYRWLTQVYPLKDGYGRVWWSNVQRSGANYQTDAICFRSLPGITGQEGTSGAQITGKFTPSSAENTAYPDSIKIGVECETYSSQPGVTDPNPQGGLYWDNISFVIVEGAPLPLSNEIWNEYQDAFPWNEGVTEGFTAAFDTAGVLVKTGLNIGPGNGFEAWDVPGDSVVVAATGTAPLRVDIVFRILPGPGNYVTVGNPASGLAVNPQAAFGTRVAATPQANSTNFWRSYLSNNGPFGTPGGHAGGVWNPNVWNSARLDTVEANIFSLNARGILGGPGNKFAYQGTLHEAERGIAQHTLDPADPTDITDPYTVSNIRGGLGLPRRKCYLASLTAAATDIDCVHDAGTTDGSTYDLTYVTAAGSGFPATENGPTGAIDRNLTAEGTKIIPDGLLTPGANVQYFYRKAEAGSTTQTGLEPDTNLIVPQLGERDNDGHRWQSFSALPDRWKDTNYTHPISSITPGPPACLLVVDNQDGNTGDEGAWVSVADSIGATAAAKWGAHNGWHAPGTIDVANPAAPGFTSTFVARNGGSAGTIWDFYEVRAAEDTNPAGSFGARYAFQDATNTQIYSKRQQSAPTLDQLKAFYKVILVLSGNLNSVIWGPEPGRSADDTGLFENWLLSGDPITVNRVAWFSGNGFIENAHQDLGGVQLAFIQNRLGVDFTAGGLRTLAGAPLAREIDLSGRDNSQLDQNATVGTVTPVYGVRNLCNQSLDVLKIATGPVSGQTSVLTYYGNQFTVPQFPSGVLKAHSAGSPWVALTDGFHITALGSRFLADTYGRSHYFRDVLVRVFGGLCPNLGSPVVPLDVPNVDNGNMLADFVNLRNNPLTSGFARIHFGLAKKDHVTLRIFDVTSREVRVLANRTFEAGEHDLVWDGTDNDGHPVPRGVYFAQTKYKEGAFNDAKKLIVLK